MRGISPDSAFVVQSRSRNPIHCRGSWLARRSAAAPFGLPSFTPRLLATASASFVRLEIASRSCLRHQRHDPDGEVVRLRQVDRGELHVAVPQRQQEGGIARQPVELGDHQRRPGDLAAPTCLAGAAAGRAELQFAARSGCRRALRVDRLMGQPAGSDEHEVANELGRVHGSVCGSERLPAQNRRPQAAAEASFAPGPGTDAPALGRLA